MGTGTKKFASSGILMGLFILLVGFLWMIKRAENLHPEWILSKGTVMIGFGTIIAIQTRFRGFIWIVIIAVGKLLLFRDLYPGHDWNKFILPAIIVMIGLFVVLSSFGFGKGHHRYGCESEEDEGDSIRVSSVFGGVKKNIISKNFRGGEITNICGGTELNLSHADIQGTIVIHFTQICGGTKLIIPSHWEVVPETTNIFGGTDDKRNITESQTEQGKRIILKGISMMGGIDIRTHD